MQRERTKEKNDSSLTDPSSREKSKSSKNRSADPSRSSDPDGSAGSNSSNTSGQSTDSRLSANPGRSAHSNSSEALKPSSDSNKSAAIGQTHAKVGQAPDHSIGSPHVRGGHSSVNASHIKEGNPMIPHKINEDEEINFFDQEDFNEGGPGAEKKDRMEWDPDKGEDVGH